MRLEKLLSRVLVVGSLSVGSYNCDSATPDSCVKDTDCKGDRICVSGVCQQQGSYGGADTSGSNKYTCETYCNNHAECCKMVPTTDYPDYNTCVSDLNDGPPKKNLQEEIQGCISYCNSKNYLAFPEFKCRIDNQLKYKCDYHLIDSVCDTK